MHKVPGVTATSAQRVGSPRVSSSAAPRSEAAPPAHCHAVGRLPPDSAEPAMIATGVSDSISSASIALQLRSAK